MPSLGWLESAEGRLFCASFPHVCTDTLKYLMHPDPELDNYERADVFVGHEPCGTSVMNMAHWKQLLDRKAFQGFDYGSIEKNMQHYGHPTPPKYDLGMIRVPIRLFSGASDELADRADVDYLWSLLNPSVREFRKEYDSGHVTFMWGKTV